MCTTRTSYLEELRSSVNAVSGGEHGSIVNNVVLLRDYTPEMLDGIRGFIEEGDDSVKAELIMLLTNLKVQSVKDEVLAISEGSSDIVRKACDSYLRSVRDMSVLLRMITMRNPHVELGGGLSGR